jgi:type IV secretion system protein VirD4
LLRPDDWGGQVRGPHLELAIESVSGLSEESEGGLQQQRHPGIGDEPIARPIDTDPADPLGLGDDDSDAAADKRAMDRVRPLSAVARAHAVNEGDDDLLPRF